MANSYGVDITNRYALFIDDESDPLEADSLKKLEEQFKKTQAAGKENAVPPQEKKVAKNKKEASSEDKKKTPEATRNREEHSRNRVERPPKFENSNPGRRDYVRRSPGNVRENREEKSEIRSNPGRRDYVRRSSGNVRENREEKSGIRSNPGRGDYVRRSPGNVRENREEKSGIRGRGREYQTYPKGPRRSLDAPQGQKVEPAQNQSKSDKTDVESVPAPDAAAEEVKTEDTQPKGEPKNVEITSVEAPVQEEPEEFTLEEYKAILAKREKPQYNVRRAGEGDDTKWESMYQLEKKDETSEEEEVEINLADYPQRVGKQKRVSAIEIKFNNSQRRDERRQKFNARGNRPNSHRSAGNGSTQENQSGEVYQKRQDLKIDYERDFPSLG